MEARVAGVQRAREAWRGQQGARRDRTLSTRTKAWTVFWVLEKSHCRVSAEGRHDKTCILKILLKILFR